MIIEIIASSALCRKFIYQVLASLITFTVLRLAIFYRVRHRRFQLFKSLDIPGPEQNIIDGNLSDYLEDNIAASKDKQFRAKYGKVYGVFLGDEPNLIITDLEILKKIFFESSGCFKERAGAFIENEISAGILFARYDRWKAMRKAISPAFGKYSTRGSRQTEFIENSVGHMIDYIDQRQLEAKSTNQEAKIDIQDLMKATALHLINAMAVELPGTQVREGEPYVKSLDEFMSTADKGVVVFAIRFPFIKVILQFLANHFEYDRTLALIKRTLDAKVDAALKRLANHETDERNYQVIDSLIKLHYEGKLSRQEVLGNAEVILMAGYDTTSTTLTYILWILAKYPKIQEKLRDELKAHGVESKYLLQVINETMRLYPTVVSITTRLATETVKINDLIIPEGTKVVYNNLLMFRDPNIWPEPEKFDPERFRDGVEHHPCAFAPFGLGDRKCLGYQLALLEMRMVVCDILLRHKLDLISPQTLELIRYGGVLSKPKEKIMLRINRLEYH